MKLWTIVVMLVVALPFHIAAAEEQSFFFNFPPERNPWPIMLAAPGSGEIFEAAESALDIECVKSDGVEVTAKEELTAGAPRTSSIRCDKKFVMYQFSSDAIFCAKTFTEPLKGHRQLRFYSVPQAAKKIEIWYRVRFPDGSRSGIFSVTGFVNNYNLHILQDQAKDVRP